MALTPEQIRSALGAQYSFLNGPESIRKLSDIIEQNGTNCMGLVHAVYADILGTPLPITDKAYEIATLQTPNFRAVTSREPLMEFDIVCTFNPTLDPSLYQRNHLGLYVPGRLIPRLDPDENYVLHASYTRRGIDLTTLSNLLEIPRYGGFIGIRRHREFEQAYKKETQPFPNIPTFLQTLAE